MRLHKMVSEWWMKKGVDSRKLSHFMDYLEQHECLAAVESISRVDYYFSDRFSLWDIPEVYVMLRFHVSVNSKYACLNTNPPNYKQYLPFQTTSYLAKTRPCNIVHRFQADQQFSSQTVWVNLRIELLKLIESIIHQCVLCLPDINKSQSRIWRETLWQLP